MRIAISMTVLIDLIIRFSDVQAFYSDSGIWPRALVYNFSWNAGFWSFHLLSGSHYWEAFLFFLHFLVAFFLLVGYKTRLFSLLTWMFCISLHNRNVFILQSGDDLLRMILFWGIFLPWNLYYSIDAKKKRVLPKHFVVASIGYLFLISSVYIFSVALKSSAEWRMDGSAIYYALSLEQLRLPVFGDFLYQFPVLMKVLTHIVYLMECVIPILILWPSKNKYLRLVTFLMVLILHLGIGIHLFVGLFPIICIASCVALLPDSFIVNIENKIRFRPSYFFVKQRATSKLIYLQTTFLTLIIFMCLFINLEKLRYFKYELRNEMYYIANVLRLNQNWGMFSPDVLKKDGWLVYFGTDSIGRQWDLRLNRDFVDYAKPEHIVSMYKNDRWRKLAENMQNDYFTFLRPRYCNYVLKQWNNQHPKKKMLYLNLYYMEKENLANYKTSTIKKQLYCMCNGI